MNFEPGNYPRTARDVRGVVIGVPLPFTDTMNFSMWKFLYEKNIAQKEMVGYLNIIVMTGGGFNLVRVDKKILDMLTCNAILCEKIFFNQNCYNWHVP